MLDTTSCGFLASGQNFKKLLIQLQENPWTDGRTKGQKDGRTNRPYFTGHFPLTLSVQKEWKKIHLDDEL